METLDILIALVKGGMTPIGACAMGGNMAAESGMKSNIAQRGMTKLTDEEYTAAADSGRLDFVNDAVGYGLCQWTYHVRKANLYDFAKKNGKSIGDEAMQVQFCLWEMKTDYPETWRFLQIEKDLRCCTSWICEEYERPAVNNIEARYKYAQQMYKDYGPILEKVAEAGNGENQSPVDVGDIDREPPSYIMPTVKTGDRSPEAYFMLALLSKLGYDVLWLGLDACLRDFQQKRGLEADGICGEKTWRELLK